MKLAHVAMVFLVITVSACGPVETFPPHDDAGTPTPDAGSTCNGVCLPAGPQDWYGPTLVWMGDEASAPVCPAIAPNENFRAHGYLSGPIPCSACTCGPTNGSCDLVATVTAAAASCADNGSGVTHTSSNPPVGWAGACNGENAIPPGTLCGGVACVQSISIAPARPKEMGCLPSESTPASPPPWDRFAVACFAPSFPGCNGNNLEVCAAAAPGPEFKQCYFQRGDPAIWNCPLGYPNKSVFYDKVVPKCAPCACDKPSGSTCTGTIDLYQDGSCTTPLGTSISINATDPVCIDVPPGSGLGSKSENKAYYNPGSCKPSGGAPEGRVVCCMP